MRCEKCGKNPASFHYTEVVNGVKNEHHLCSECAANTDISYYSSVFDGNMHLGKLLSGILGGEGLLNNNEQKDPAVNIKCPNCGMTYGEFVSNSVFGCPECYDVFGPLISDKIKKIQGSDSHIGKKPMVYGETKPENYDRIMKLDDEDEIQKEIDILSKKLKEAVEEEHYIDAAKYRDMIAELKGKEEKHA